MARIVKEEEYAEKRKQILEVTQRLIYTRGYEQMAIQDILDELHISKGAFYHYFSSKQALLEALIEHMMQEAEKVLIPIVQDAGLPALEKFQRFFDTISRWKTDRKKILLALLTSWYSDDNAIVRQKASMAGLKWFAPMLTTIICQGVQEGVVTTSYPEQVSGVIISLMYGLGDAISESFLPNGLNHDSLQHIDMTTVAVYTDAIERILGVPPHSVQFLDPEILKEWQVS
ncbi:MAG: TetR/AcrR family transcriptional regulator [Anaerolineaceae bacterium]|nr:TetR/AcrR family transcriptional regulator [Anaerolineaceae bacterium]